MQTARALAANLVPAAGAALFGWSYLVALLMIYVDAFALVAGVSLVLAVSIASEDPPAVQRSGVRRVRYIGAVWAAGVAVLGFFPFVGAVLLFSMLGLPWRQLAADLAAEPSFATGVAAVFIVHLRDAVTRLRGDLDSSERDAIDDFSLMLLRAFAFPVIGGLVLAAAAPFGRTGQLVVLVLLALTMTAGDLYRDAWLRLLKHGKGSTSAPESRPAPSPAAD